MYQVTDPHKPNQGFAEFAKRWIQPSVQTVEFAKLANMKQL